jgi:hypothetical protein
MNTKHRIIRKNNTLRKTKREKRNQLRTNKLRRNKLNKSKLRTHKLRNNKLRNNKLRTNKLKRNKLKRNKLRTHRVINKRTKYKYGGVHPVRWVRDRWRRWRGNPQDAYQPVAMEDPDTETQPVLTLSDISSAATAAVRIKNKAHKIIDDLMSFDPEGSDVISKIQHVSFMRIYREKNGNKTDIIQYFVDQLHEIYISVDCRQVLDESDPNNKRQELKMMATVLYALNMLPLISRKYIIKGPQIEAYSVKPLEQMNEDELTGVLEDQKLIMKELVSGGELRDELRVEIVTNLEHLDSDSPGTVPTKDALLNNIVKHTNYVDNLVTNMNNALEPILRGIWLEMSSETYLATIPSEYRATKDKKARLDFYMINAEISNKLTWLMTHNSNEGYK